MRTARQSRRWRWGYSLLLLAGLGVGACGLTSNSSSDSDLESVATGGGSLEAGPSGEGGPAGGEAGGAPSDGEGKGLGAAGAQADGANSGGNSKVEGGSAGAGAGVGSDESDSLVEACYAYAAARCERVHECGGHAQSVCSPSECPDLLFSEGSSFTKESAQACAQQWEDFDCLALFEMKLPECESWQGARADGESCVYDKQCAGNCAASSNECGSCVPLSTGPNCGDEVRCDGLGSCVYDSISDWYCARDVPHPDVLAEYPRLGEPCTVDCEPGVICLLQRPSDPVCMSYSAVAEVGAACFISNLSGTGFKHCGGDLGCRAEDDTCQPLPGEGEPCMVEAFSRDRGCKGELVCVENSPVECENSWPCVLENGSCQRPGGPGTACLEWGRTSRGACRKGEVCLEELCFLQLELGQEGCDGEFALCENESLCEDDVCVVDERLLVVHELCGP